MFKKILVAVDGSDEARRALDAAVDLSGKYGSKLALVHVVREMQVPLNPGLMQEYEAMERQRHNLLLKAGEQLILQSTHLAEAKGQKDVDSDIESGDPAYGIARYAERNGVDLIVLGRRGLGKERGVHLGSVARKLVNITEIGCFIVR